MNKEYMEPSMEIVVFDDSVFTNNLTVSGSELNPNENQDGWS